MVNKRLNSLALLLIENALFPKINIAQQLQLFSDKKGSFLVVFFQYLSLYIKYVISTVSLERERIQF